jgi:predicted lipid-binding transport protein (Tim44 family)
MPPERYRREKGEKQEKREKDEKMEKREQPEKYEKQEFGILGPLIGGLIVILVGFMFYLAVTGALRLQSLLPIFLIIIGAIVIMGVIAGAVMAKGRHPKT